MLMSFLLLLSLTVFSYLPTSSEACFTLKKITPNSKLRVKEGQDITLSCTANNYYEWCTFIHPVKLPLKYKQKSEDMYQIKKCDFVWTNQAKNITTLNCSDYHNRAIYVGDYENYNCAIKLMSVIEEDTGNWTCVLEEWTDGYYRGYGKRITGHMDVVILPKNPIRTSANPVHFFSTTNVIFIAIPSIVIFLLLFIIAYRMYFTEYSTTSVVKNGKTTTQISDDVIKEEYC